MTSPSSGPSLTPNDNRILLNPVLAGEQTLDQIVLDPLSWYRDNGITLHLGKQVAAIDRTRRIVNAEDGTDAANDRLLIATGKPIHPAGAGQGHAGCRRLPGYCRHAGPARFRHAVVIGGGPLGLEAANGLKLRGMDVTVVHIMPWPMERQFDDTAGKLLQKSLEERGLKFMIGTQTECLLGNERVSAERFKDGRQIPADPVAIAAGIRPNTELAEPSGLHCHRGIVVSDTLQTTADPHIYAAGECAAHRGIAYGWWRRCSSRARSARRTWPSSASAATWAARPAPSSR
jgi:nitrite reductase (NADH) large subunit